MRQIIANHKADNNRHIVQAVTTGHHELVPCTDCQMASIAHEVGNRRATTCNTNGSRSIGKRNPLRTATKGIKALKNPPLPLERVMNGEKKRLTMMMLTIARSREKGNNLISATVNDPPSINEDSDK